MAPVLELVSYAGAPDHVVYSVFLSTTVLDSPVDVVEAAAISPLVPMADEIMKAPCSLERRPQACVAFIVHFSFRT